MLVCIDKGRFMHGLLTTAAGFAVNVLNAHQADLAQHFARPSEDRFAGVATHRGRRGLVGGQEDMIVDVALDLLERGD